MNNNWWLFSPLVTVLSSIEVMSILTIEEFDDPVIGRCGSWNLVAHIARKIAYFSIHFRKERNENLIHPGNVFIYTGFSTSDSGANITLFSGHDWHQKRKLRIKFLHKPRGENGVFSPYVWYDTAWKVPKTIWKIFDISKHNRDRIIHNWINKWRMIPNFEVPFVSWVLLILYNMLAA